MASELEVGKAKLGAGGSGGTASAHADELLIDSNGNSGITIASGTSDYGGINFSDSGNNSAGIVRYDHSNDSLKLYTQTTERLAIDSSGLTTLTAGSNGVDDETLKLAFDLSGTSTVMGSIGTTNVDASNGGLTFKTVSGGTLGERLAISSTGLCTFSNGIAFQSATTGSGTGTGYTLDKYEEGTFTLTDASGAGLTIGFGGGKYTRIGNRVFITVHFDMPSNSDGQTFNLAGLPFTVHNDNDSRGLVLNYTDKSGIAYALTPKNTSNIFLYTASGGGVTNADASGGGFYINGHYVI